MNKHRAAHPDPVGPLAPARKWWSALRRRRLLRACQQRLPHAHAAAQHIPHPVQAGWLARTAGGLGAEPSGRHADGPCWELSALALSHFFDLCARQPAGLPLALPSGAADAVWHLWLASDPMGLAAWQRQWFGQEVPHREAHELGSPLPAALARSFVAACRSERRSTLSGPLPLLFALDGLVGAPGGWQYARAAGGIVHRDLTAQGPRQGSLRRHPELSAAGLAGLGLLSAAELQAWRHRREGADGGTAVSADGCSHGSTCGGCSCGSSCGGGCGS